MEDFFNSAGGSMAAGALSSLSNSLVNFGLNSYMQDKQFALNNAMYDKMFRDNLKMWNMTNEYNSPAADRARKEAAGYNALDDYGANPAQPLNAPSMSGVSPMPVSFDNPYEAAFNAATAKANLDLISSQKREIDSRTQGNIIENEFNSACQESRIQAEKYKSEGFALKNEETRHNIKLIDDKREEISHNIKLLVEQTESEDTKQLLMDAEKNLNDAKSAEIYSLLPVMQRYWSAKTEGEKAIASYYVVETAIKNGLLDGGIVDAQLRSARADAEKSEVGVDTAKAERTSARRQSQMDAARAAIATGTFFGDKPGLANGLLRVGWAINESYGPAFGALLGFGAGRLGSNAAKAAEATKGNTQTFYGAYGSSRLNK